MLEEGALELARGAEQGEEGGQSCTPVSQGRVGRRSQPLARDDEVTAPCFPSKRRGLGKNGEHCTVAPSSSQTGQREAAASRELSLSGGGSLQPQPPGLGLALPESTQSREKGPHLLRWG